MSRKRRRPLAFENLERRDVPAVLAAPWADPTHLTLSFAPDGTQIAGHVSGLFTALNAQQPTATWEQMILQAFQTWAVQANINISLTSDSGAAFGTPGPSQHDPRFGDIRVGAQAMSPDVMAITVPGNPDVSGSWTGDVLFNTQYRYGDGGYNLFSVALHEAGHALGLDDSTDPKSVMYGQYQNAASLSSGDIAAIQALYGARAPDLHEGSGGDDSPNKAATIQPPGSFDGSTPLVVFGDISSVKDLDYYTFRGPSGYTGPVTIRLQSAGISLLTTKLTILDASGKIVGQPKAASGFGDVVTLSMANVSPNATYTVLVQGATSGAFGIGHYGLAVSFDGRNKVAPATLDTVLRGDYQTLGPNDIDALLRDPTHALVNNHQHSDDTPGTALRLTSTPGYPTNTHYDAVGSLVDKSDVNVYRIQTPNGSGSKANVLTVTLRSLAPGGVAPRVTLVDETLTPLTSGQVRVLANGDGVYTIQATGLNAGGNIYLEVNSAASPAAAPGNYAIEARFGTVAASLTDFASGTVAPTAPTNYHLYIGETQLFRFLLSAGPSGTPGGSVEVTIRDAAGHIVADLTSAAGDVVSAPALLLIPGSYTLQVVATGGTSAHTYDLSGQEISDPIGPTISDPTLKPVFTNPTAPGTYTYPGGVVTTRPYWLTLS